MSNEPLIPKTAVYKVLIALASAALSAFVGWASLTLAEIGRKTEYLDVQAHNQREWSKEIETDVEEMGRSLNRRIDTIYNVALKRMFESIDKIEARQNERIERERSADPAGD